MWCRSGGRYFDNALPFSVKVVGLVPNSGRLSVSGAEGHAQPTSGPGHVDVVGVALQGDIEVDTLVCQGARGFGPEYEITDCEGSAVLSLDGRPAAEVIEDVMAHSVTAKASLPTDTLHVLAGVVLDPSPTRAGRAPWGA